MSTLHSLCLYIRLSALMKDMSVFLCMYVLKFGYSFAFHKIPRVMVSSIIPESDDRTWGILVPSGSVSPPEDLQILHTVYLCGHLL